ncbi:MAG: DUF2284 domain-containing protein [Desulfobacteraceae bacterium]|nr:MAG: DUF2284 domain-containing protein [Desulfobacteraceae bacterium]
MQYALELGVSDVRITDVAKIPIDNQFAQYCREPGCPSFNRSKSCPPHVMGPDRFREFIKGFDRILVFKFDIPWSVLLSNDRIEVNRVVHETAANLEIHALANGFEKAVGYAGGGCKDLFCDHHPECRVLSGDGVCRHPSQSRESMSGMGVDFTRLAKIVGWDFSQSPNPKDSSTGLMAGSVLLRSSKIRLTH